MMMRLGVLIVVAGCATSARPPAPASPPSPTCGLYVLAGQSNMDGRGRVSDLTEEQRWPFEGVEIFYRNLPAPGGDWKPLGPGYSVAPGYKGPLPSPTFGPELGFATALRKARPERRLALIKAAKGGTNLRENWKPGLRGEPGTQGPLYQAFLETVSTARKALEAKGDRCVLAGMIWHQGESDSKSATEVYQQQLTEFIARVREDLEQPALPFVIGEVFDNRNRDTVRAAQKAVAASVPGVGLASADGLATLDPGTHFDTKSQLILGERFADAMGALLEAKR